MRTPDLVIPVREGRNFNMFADCSLMSVTRRHVDLLRVASDLMCCCR